MGNQQTDVQKRNAALARHGIGAGVLAGTVLMTTQANALDTTKATGESTAKTDIETGALWILGVVLVIFSARKVIGFFGR